MTAAARLELPDWPRLMPVDLAAAYLGIGVTMLEEQGPAAKRLGRRKLYDRNDLDRWADRLDGQPLEEQDSAVESKAIEKRFLERRQAKGR